MSSSKTICVDVISDVACPWCWVGKRAIEAAAANLGVTVELHWKPFQLDPEIPSGVTRSRADRLAQIVGGHDVVAQWVAHPETIPMNRAVMAGKLANISFRMRAEDVQFSTYRCHMLLTHAGPITGNWAKQSALKEAMLRMTHQSGKNLDLMPELIAAATEAGVATTQAEVEAILNDAKVKAMLDHELLSVRQARGFNGVPHFTFPNKQHLSGGQPVDVFEKVLRANM